MGHTAPDANLRAMPHALTPAVRQRLADALMQTTPPSYAKLGRGGFDAATNQPKLPASDLYEVAPDLYPALSVTRSSGNDIVVTVILPQSDTFTTFSELAIYAADGTCLEHATFVPQVLGAGVEGQFVLSMLPEVYA